MQFIYKPEGAPDDKHREWAFEPAKLMSPEAEAIERLTGMTFVEWQEAVLNGSMSAIHGLLYVLLKRENPTLKYGQVVFSMSEVDFDFNDDEKVQLRAALEEQATERELNDDEKQLLASLDEDAEPPVEDPEDGAEGEDPKES